MTTLAWTTLGLTLALGPAPAQAPPEEETRAAPAPEATPAVEAGAQLPEGVTEVAPAPAPAAEPGPAVAPLGPDVDVAPTTAQPQDPDVRDPFYGEDGQAKRRPRRDAGAVRGERTVYPERPIRYRLDLSFDAGTTVVFDDAYRGFDSGRNLPGFRLGFRGDAPLGNGRVFLGGGIGYQRFTSSGDVHQTLTTKFLIHEPIALVRLSIKTVEGLDVFIEPAGGPSIISASVESGQRATQDSVSGFFTGTAGVAAYLPKKWLPRRGSSRVTGGLELGLGYTHRPDLDISPSPTADPDETIDTETVDYGGVAIRGFAWRLGLFVRFM